ncbi:MAG: TIM barrel protein [Saprospiraceae bacterium]|nr:TIM barrel protein [Saprospiraceae bacterium]
MNKTSRRAFIKTAGMAASTIPLINIIPKPLKFQTQGLSIHIFSKHLQFLDYKKCGEMAAELGFSGVDLTVRPGGHVEPEDVDSKLKVAIDSIRNAGSTCEMITTRVGSAHDPIDVNLLTKAAQSGIKFYRLNWFKYQENMTMPHSLVKYQTAIRELSHLNKNLGLIGCYQNHAGQSIGASYWEIHKLLETADQDYFGVQYDIRHALVEGGLSWENGLKLLYPNIKTIVLKDFKWGKVDGKWKPINTPIGEGMVDFLGYFKILKKYNLNPPVSLHLEYDLGGAEKGKSEISVDHGVVYDAMKKDLKSIHEIWKAAS